ncbi:hypothetical protein NUW54_g3289 [Trametes sanguinea]|uniref:Uncharacterized protein n=1 Tax=Trametes sanguinea TaxID=158606 RepID=A0ACC1Q1F0_9APHY|nr:hypothetical protein NUW54_g3289 [Trametes sanguinea]
MCASLTHHSGGAMRTTTGVYVAYACASGTPAHALIARDGREVLYHTDAAAARPPWGFHDESTDRTTYTTPAELEAGSEMLEKSGSIPP